VPGWSSAPTTFSTGFVVDGDLVGEPEGAIERLPHGPITSDSCRTAARADLGFVGPRRIVRFT